MLPAEETLYLEAFSTEIELLADPQGYLAITDVTASEAAANFKRATLASANVGFTRSAWWVRFTLRNDSDAERRVFVRQTYPLIDYLQVFSPRTAGGFEVVSTGDRQPFATRPVANRDFIFSAHDSGGSRAYLLYAVPNRKARSTSAWRCSVRAICWAR